MEIDEESEVVPKEEEESDEEDEDKKDVLEGGTAALRHKGETKPGIIYLSTIPPKMNVLQIREYFTEFGPIDRSFLQPDTTKTKKVGKKNSGRPKNQTFTEGWIEFKKRRHAKKVAALLNNTPVGGKKSKEYHDHLWNIKYLPGFQWVHLNERLAYERISKKAKIRTEISAAKRESSHFAKNVQKSRALKKRSKSEAVVPTDADA